MLGGGVEKPQGAENSALKNTAPFSLTPLRISENASTGSSGLSAKFAGLSAKESAQAGRPAKTSSRSGMDGLAKPLHNGGPDIAWQQSDGSIDQGGNDDKLFDKYRESK
jgi:hypothetical protein